MKVFKCPHCRGLIELSGIVDDIRDFHEKFGLPPEGDKHLPIELAEFRDDFLKEEALEFETARENGDQEKMLDAVVDIVYVALGTAYLAKWDFMEAWHRVHAANMQKVRRETSTIKMVESGRPPKYDVVKPVGWEAPNLKDLVKENS